MALSQVQCLDDNHVNPRTHESKPEFFYCEDQRLALEALLQDGRDAFLKFLEARGLRGFLSDPEIEAFAGAVEPYDPNSELVSESTDDGEPPLSLHYWPELSDKSVPQMDLGWPDSEAYRGVTRTTVYAQPPLGGQAHIKEVVRKMIAQAQKVIAVVMDVFTDVDIFRDLLDAGFKKKISIYILLERTALPHFLSMCQRANMHTGHLKNLRVRSTGGADFLTRSCTRVRGRVGHRFMFIDGDKAVSGSYSFTWMSSRLDRHLITVVTGQAVDAFDRLFRFLYMTSSSVDLRQVATAAEPEPEPPPQPASMALPSAALARKLYNPKYALVVGSNTSPSSNPSSGNNSPKESNSQNPTVTATRKRRRRKSSIEALQEAPPLHPGLVDLEKACLISYLPVWPEPDPPSDVIGFINIRDASRPTQVHLQRSEMFEVSQAIRFSSPVTMPKETLPEVAMPRKLSVNYEEMLKLQPGQHETANSAADGVQPAQRNAGRSDIGEAPKQEVHTSGSESEKESSVEDKMPDLKTPSTKQDGSHNAAPHLSPHTSQQVSNEASSVHNEETLPEVAKSKQLTPKHQGKAEDAVADTAKPTQLNSGLSDVKSEAPKQEVCTSGAESEPEKETREEEDNMPDLNKPVNQDVNHDTTTQFNAHTLQQFSNEASSVHNESERHAHTNTHAASMNVSTPESLPVSKSTEQTEPNLNTHTDNVYSAHRLDLYGMETSHFLEPFSTHVKSQLNAQQQTENTPQCTYLQTEAVQPQRSPEGTTAASIPTPTHSNVSPSSAPQSDSTSSSSSSSSSANVGTPYSSSAVPAFASSSTNLQPRITAVPTPRLPSSTTSSSSPTVPPVPKPRTFQLVIKDRDAANSLDLPMISIISTKSPTGRRDPQTSVSDALPKKENKLETVSEQQNNSEITAVVQKDTENTRKLRGGFAPQQTQSETSQEEEGICEKSVAAGNDFKSRAAVSETKLRPQSDVLISDTIKADSADIQQVMPREAEPKTLTPKPEMECVVTESTETEEETQITSWEVSNTENEENKNATQRSVCLARASEPEKISYSEMKPQNRASSESADSLEAATDSSASSTRMQKHNPGSVSDTIKDSADSTHIQQRHPSVTSAHKEDSSQKPTQRDTQESQEVLQSSHTPERSLSLHFTNPPTHTPELHSLTPERESCLFTPLSPPDRFSACTPTPDSHTHTADPLLSTPDLQTPTPDVSDGYVSSREDSTLSTTSDEYYECRDSPFHEPVFDQAAHHGHWTEDHVSLAHTNTASTNAGNTTPTQSPPHINYSARDAAYSSSESSSDSETQSLSEYSVSIRAASSYSPEKKDKMRKEMETVNNKMGRDEDGHLAERNNKTEMVSLPLSLEKANNQKGRDDDGHWAEGSNRTEVASLPLSLESKTITNQLNEQQSLPEVLLTLDKAKAAQNQASKRKRVVVVSRTENFIPTGDMPGGPNNEGSEAKRLSPDRLPAEKKREDKVGDKSAETAALRPSSVDRKDVTRSARDTENQKSLHTQPKPPRGQQQQQNSEASSLSKSAQPSRPPHLLPGTQPPGQRVWGNLLQLNQAESNAFPNSFQPPDNASPPHRPPSRPPTLLAAGRKQAEVSQNPQSSSTAWLSRAQAGQPQSKCPYPKPQGSFLHTWMQTQLHAQPEPVSSHNQTPMQAQPDAKQGSEAVVATGEAPGQEEGRTPFGFTFSRLYSLKGLKDRMSKLPMQSKRSSTRNPVQAPKSTG